MTRRGGAHLSPWALRDGDAALAVAEAAVRLVARMGATGIDTPWWWWEDVCVGCLADALDWRIVAHFDGCPALALDAAIAAWAAGGGA